MPKPSITPTGEIATLSEKVYDLLKADADFQSWAGVASEADAELHLYPYHLGEAEIQPFQDPSASETLPLLVFDAPDEDDNPDDEVELGVETKGRLKATLRFIAFKEFPASAQNNSGEAAWFLSNEETVLRNLLSALEGQTSGGLRLTHQGVKTVRRIATLSNKDWLSQLGDTDTVIDRYLYSVIFDVPFGIGGGE